MSDEYIHKQDAINVISIGGITCHKELVDIWEIEAIPAADVVPVVHGVWERIPYSFAGGYRCSCCGQKTMENFWLYCPNCGAKMDGERKE